MIDKELIENCRIGKLKEFRKHLEASSPFAFSVAFRMPGDEDMAEDIVQQTMISDPDVFYKDLFALIENDLQLKRYVEVRINKNETAKPKI